MPIPAKKIPNPTGPNHQNAMNKSSISKVSLHKILSGEMKKEAILKKGIPDSLSTQIFSL